uniref:BACK domain-containing protein n=1 Tax=Pavo cristatus TaxID=9049 RepID=A0A8C9FII3_PAVCR
MAAPGSEKSSKKKTEKKLAAREEAKLLAGFMGVMNSMRKQVRAGGARRDCPLCSALMRPRLEYCIQGCPSTEGMWSCWSSTSPMKKGRGDLERCFLNLSFTGISVLAECLDCPELKATADDFIHQHFTEVYKTDEFLQLDVKRVTHLLNQDTLTVRAEDQVYDAAVRWLKYDEPNRQPYMVDILAKVRFPLISKNFLSKTVQAEPLIQDNPECLKMVISKLTSTGGGQGRRRKEVMLQSIRHYLFFVMQDYSWTDIRCPFEKRRDAACVFWDNVVYILGGSQLFPIKRMDCYNVVKDSWYSKLGPPTPRDSLAACAAEGKIYTSGGSELLTYRSCVPAKLNLGPR